MSEERRVERTRVYLLLLPGQNEPQQFAFLTGLTGWGLKIQIADKVQFPDPDKTGKVKKITPDSIRLSIGEREIPESEHVDNTIGEDQVIEVRVSK